MPLNLCNYTLILAAIAMISKKRWAFALVYFWGIGAIFAILTPDIRTSFPDYRNISFFLTHFYIFTTIFYGIFYYDFKVNFKDYKAAIKYINLAFFIVFPFDLIFKTNYMFLRHKPISSPMDFLGPWPYYIIWLEILMIILFTIIYLPTHIKTRLKK